MKKWMLILVLIGFWTKGQEVKTTFPNSVTFIGDTVGLFIKTQTPLDTKVTFPQLKDSLNNFVEILDAKLDSAVQHQNKIYRLHLILTCFDEGEYIVNSIPIQLNDSTYFSKSFQLKVKAMEVDTTKQNLFPIKPILPEQITWWEHNRSLVFKIAGVVLGLILLTLLILYIIRSKKKNQYISKPLLPPFEEAMENLKTLDKKQLWQNGKVKTYYTDLSFIIRRYFSRRFEFSGLALLSDDLANYMIEKEYLIPEEGTQLNQFLKEADLVKFAKKIPSEENHINYRKQVESLIQKTKPLFEEEIKDHA